MATFEAQVEGLTGLSIDGSSAPTQTELSQFLTDGAKEVLNALPKTRQRLFTTSNALNASSPTLTLGGSEVFGVVRNDDTINQPCRQIAPQLEGRVRDSSDMAFATATDPVFFIRDNILNIIPTPTNAQSGIVQTLNYPTVAFGDSAIAKFPDDGEYLVPIYASIKSLQNAIESIRALSNTQFDSAVSSNTAEDVEIATSHLNAGNAYLNEIASMEKQQVKLQADYDKGLAYLVG